MMVFREDVDLPRVIATGSPRRRSQLSERFPEVEWKEIRGNVGTRLRKIAEDHEADATVLAAAGLKRLGIESFPGLGFKPFEVDDMVPAPGQAAIALQVPWVNDLSKDLSPDDIATATDVIEYLKKRLEEMG